MRLDVRAVESSGAVELYITATPSRSANLAEQAREIFGVIADVLCSRKASILLERAFVPAGSMPELDAIRSSAYGNLRDGVSPCWLVSPSGEIAGIQVHAIVASQQPRILALDGAPLARVIEQGDLRWIIGNGLIAPQAGNAPAQAQAIFQNVASLMQQGGGDMRSVARTWLFMDKILEWYDDLNKVRTRFFIERGVIGNSADENRMPASTGIGVSPAGSARLAVDFFGVVGRDDAIRRYHAAGKQKSAMEYGSAFARAARATTPGGRTVFVSGTAAIDMAGATCLVGDAKGQIRLTMENVLAVLRDMSCQPKDVVQAMAYCPTPEIEAAFKAAWLDELPWPWVTVVGDVCRSDLLFEVEAAACQSAKK